MKPYVLILGAKSAIARAIAHEYARNGYNLYLAGRGMEELQKDASDLKIRYKCEAEPVAFDALDYDSHQAVYDGLPHKPAIAICVVGTMPEQKAMEKDLELARRTIASNFTGCANMLSVIANDMEARKTGGIIGISSVAGERGRASNYFYGSAKAGFTAFLSGLRNRLAFAGVHVMTVKPGFVRTAMTEDLDLPARLTAEPEQVAKAVFKGFKRKKNTIYTLWMWRYVMKIIRSIPEWKFKKMKL